MPHPKVFVVSSFGKIFHVDIGRDGKGAFLGYGWPEFVKASGFGLGWFLVLQHEGRGVLTVKAFDLTWCLKELGGFPPSTGRLLKKRGKFRVRGKADLSLCYLITIQFSSVHNGHTYILVTEGGIMFDCRT